MSSAGDVLIAAIGLVLTGAGLPEAAIHQNGDGAGTGFLAAPVAGAAAPRAAVTWYEDGKPIGGTGTPAGKLRDCERRSAGPGSTSSTRRKPRADACSPGVEHGPDDYRITAAADRRPLRAALRRAARALLALTWAVALACGIVIAVTGYLTTTARAHATAAAVAALESR